jgi:asparagine synthase (glutamine-hydrolysing)
VGAGGYLALVARPGAEDRAGVLAARLVAGGGWRRAGAAGSIVLLVPDHDAAAVETLPDAGGFLVGDTHPAPVAPPRGSGCGLVDRARELLRTRWGRYVALLTDRAGGAAVLRDPFGELDALVWSLGDGLEVVASDLAIAPPELSPRLGVDWDAIAAYVGRSGAMRTEVLLDGVEAVQPGVLQTLPLDAASVALWRPADFATDEAWTAQDARAALRERVEACTAALAGGGAPLLVELSGGLDSAIVSGTLAQLGLVDRVWGWLNYVADTAEADERAYAAAVTDRLGAELTVVEKPLRALEEADFAEVADGLRPALQGVDAPRDRDIARRMAEGGCAVISGQGGDAVFFQMPSVLVAAGELRRLGLKGLGSPVLRAVSHRTRKSVWRVLAEARAAERGGRLPAQVSPLAPQRDRSWLEGLEHPWERDAGGVSPAKRLQIRAIANGALYRGDCRKRRAGEMLYPLLCQPVVELCLAIPAHVLAGGEQDRRLAREAFADRVPAAVLARRSKGELGSYYGRMIAESLGFLRPYLLDGVLADGGAIDRAATARLLEPEALLRAPATGPVLTAVAVEAWVRRWQGRVADSVRAPRARTLR